MNLLLRSLTIGLCSLLLASLASSQETPQDRGKKKAHKRGKETPVLIPASEAKPEEQTPAPAGGKQEPHKDDHGHEEEGHEGHNHGGISRSFGAQDPHHYGSNSNPADLDPTQPRPAAQRATMPYLSVRPLLDVNGVAITTGELNELVLYYQSFRQNVIDMHLANAVKAMLPRKVLEAKFRKDLPAMKQRIDQAVAEYQNGAEWKAVVAKYSDDAEAENPEGIYELGRERAVQPFDRYSHVGVKGKLVGPFLTVYGYHVLEITNYTRGKEAKDDVATVRHILVMYPELKKMDAEDKDIRKFIKAEVKAAKIKALESGAANLVPQK